jgi:cephalosporin-C deacetylase
VSQGILDRNRYYYRRVYVDAVRAVEAARTAPGVDPRRVAVTGISQGGGIALAVGGLVKDLLLVMSSVPFLCDFRRAVYLTNENPYAEIRRYLATHPGLVETTFRTLDYFDGVNFAKRATAPAVFSTALLDPVCPPATVQAAIQAYASDKTVDVWPFNGHEGGGVQQQVMNIGRLQRILAAPPS